MHVRLEPHPEAGAMVLEISGDITCGTVPALSPPILQALAGAWQHVCVDLMAAQLTEEALGHLVCALEEGLPRSTRLSIAACGQTRRCLHLTGAEVGMGLYDDLGSALYHRAA